MLSIQFPATYLLIIYLSQSSPVIIGKLGERTLKPGYYSYVGSARQHAASRLLRHIHGDATKKRWHIDYLRAVSELIQVQVYHEEQISECRLAEEVRAVAGAEIPIRRFGASDCHCLAHLHYHGEQFPTLRFSVQPVVRLYIEELKGLTAK